jgi:hypothetical protein
MSLNMWATTMTNEPKDNPDKVGYENEYEKMKYELSKLRTQEFNDAGTMDALSYKKIHDKYELMFEAQAIREGERIGIKKATEYFRREVKGTKLKCNSCEMCDKDEYCELHCDIAEHSIRDDERQQALKEVEKAVKELETVWVDDGDGDGDECDSGNLDKLKVLQAIDQLRNKGREK